MCTGKSVTQDTILLNAEQDADPAETKHRQG
jgi:hypothetical protein